MADDLSELLVNALACAEALAPTWFCHSGDTAPEHVWNLLANLGDFLAAAKIGIETRAAQYRGRYSGGPPEFQGLMGASYHEKAWWYAVEVYRRAFNQTPYLKPGERPRDWATIRECWPQVATALAEVPTIDASRLQDCIRDESARAIRAAADKMQAATTPPAADEGPQAPAADTLSAGRGVAPRNEWFLQQYETPGDTFHKPSKVCAKWNAMKLPEREAICPDRPETVLRDAVVTGFKRARKSRGDEPAARRKPSKPAARPKRTTRKA
jgi:hypothetical protein